MSFIQDFKDSLTYPFEDSQWIQKLWPLPLLAILPIIGVLSVILLKGWRFEMVKRLSTGDRSLPEFDIVTMFQRGLLLWAVMIAHMFIPGVICALLGLSGPLGLIQDIYEFFANGLSGWAQSQSQDLLLKIIVYVVWGIISAPVFQSGMIRYVISGDWKSLVNVPVNFMFFLRYIHYFLKFYVAWIMLIILVVAMDSVLSVTGIGLLLVPIVSFVFYYISSAHELGHLAYKINKKENRVESTEVAALSSQP
ncbi:hypothetical protein MAQ5080_02630 [Marinomonas aquimarina]|uniref:DUF4013 domain-containing protein n=1 Tax=Marinomonas aquimarina TaxID=295068 RepID=A0A1A8TM49_9GAMM|nr:DUF4013 domain-containing protein [Marinomonas aquimarina]SBS33627.1 hypothetical protein MAQ5080_02630 [Marinomonas aquimarina]